MSGPSLPDRHEWCSADGRINYVRPPTGWFPENVTAEGRDDHAVLVAAGLIEVSNRLRVRFRTRIEAVAAVSLAFAGHDDPPDSRIRRRRVFLALGERFDPFGLRRVDRGWVVALRNHRDRAGAINKVNRALWQRDVPPSDRNFHAEWRALAVRVHPTRRVAIDALAAWLETWPTADG